MSSSPVKPKAEWPAVKAFTKAIADSMASDSPEQYVATIAKAKRTGKILVDYLRNQRGTTAVAAYSTRARPGARRLDAARLGGARPGDRAGLFHRRERACRDWRRSRAIRGRAFAPPRRRSSRSSRGAGPDAE